MKELRKKIDRIDSKISELLDERARIVKEIGKEKKQKKEPVFAPEREAKILNKLAEDSKKEEGFPLKAKLNIFSEIFAGSRSLQKKLTISYLGPEATFTHLAAVKKFSEHCDYTAASSISQVFRDVEKSRADYGVVPVENSTEGIVSHTLDMFIDSDCKICSELVMEISLYLLSKENDLSGIKTVYSKDQALAQCRNWLEEHLPNARYAEVASTTKAALIAKEEKNSAAVASKLAAKIYDLNILSEKIEDISENITRFFIIGKDLPGPTGNDKTTIMFSVKDRVGILHDMLTPFKKHKLNLTKIESRPSRIKAWEYLFFVDFLGHINDPKVQTALNELQESCVFLKVLGSYPVAL